jgi:hypothetical protein
LDDANAESGDLQGQYEECLNGLSRIGDEYAKLHKEFTELEAAMAGDKRDEVAKDLTNKLREFLEMNAVSNYIGPRKRRLLPAKKAVFFFS